MALVSNFPTIVAKKKVYNAAIMGFTLLKRIPTSSLSAPVSSNRISRAKRMTGAYTVISAGRYVFQRAHAVR